jgi:hypothetical protein
LRYFAAVRAPSFPKPRQTVCERVRRIAHLHWGRGGGCIRWRLSRIVATRLLHGLVMLQA